MTWFLRFILGLQPRIEDLKEIECTIPELLSQPIDYEYARKLYRIHFGIHSRGNFFIDTNSNNIIKELQNWITKAKDLNSKRIDKKEYILTNNTTCVGGKCIFTNNDKSTGSPINNEEPQILELMALGGGLKRKQPLQSFLDLVRKVHKSSSHPNAIYVTDPYIYVDISEKGTSGGLVNFSSYLNALGINKESKFSLYTTNKPKKGNHKSFVKVLADQFPNAKLEQFKTNNLFHDRFYIVDHGKHGFKGVFGPSVNGLTDQDIVLMGEIESNMINYLKKILCK